MKNANKKQSDKDVDSIRGGSLIEILVLLLVLGILTVISVRFMNPTLYHADQQASTALDIFTEAQNRAVTQKETMRVEINPSDRTIRIIDENTPGDASDDVVVTAKHIGNALEVIFDSTPANVSSTPDEPTPVPVIQFNKSLHPLSLNKYVATLRFLENGRVTNAGADAAGDGAAVTGATIYFWTADGEPSPNPKAILIRAITVLGNSGKARYWKCPIVNETCSEWFR